MDAFHRSTKIKNDRKAFLTPFKAQDVFNFKMISEIELLSSGIF